MNRTVHRSGTPRAILLATILAIGALVAWLVTCFISTTIYEMLAPTDRLRIDQLVFTVEGQPLLQRDSPEGAQTGDLYVYRTLEGRRIEDPESVHLTEAYADEMPIKSRFNFRTHYWVWRILALLQTRPAPVAWYLVHDGRADGRAWFVGYQPQSKQRISYFGRKGFRPDVPPEDEQFALSNSLFNDHGTAPGLSPGSSEPTGRFEAPALYLVSDGSLLKIDLPKQSVEPMSLPDKVVSVGVYDELTAVSDDRHATYKKRLLVRLPKELHILSMEGEPLRAIPLADAMQGANLSLIGSTSDEMIVVARDEKDYWSQTLYWIGPSGEVKRQEKVTLYDPPERDRSSGAWGGICILPVPSLLAGGAILGTALGERDPERPDFATAFGHLVAGAWLPFLVLLLVSGGLAWVTYRRQRALCGSSAMAWAIFVFLLGLPGFIGYWTHRRWPATARCEHCGATVPRDRATCLACAAEFPPPALKGIEVFA